MEPSGVVKAEESNPGTSLAIRYLPEIVEDISGKLKDVFSVILGYYKVWLVQEDVEKEDLERMLLVAQRGTILVEQLSALSKLVECHIAYSMNKGGDNGRG